MVLVFARENHGRTFMGAFDSLETLSEAFPGVKKIRWATLCDDEEYKVLESTNTFTILRLIYPRKNAIGYGEWYLTDTNIK